MLPLESLLVPFIYKMSYLRSKMTQAWLNHLMLLHDHQDLTDNLDLEHIANDYIYFLIKPEKTDFVIFH